MAEKHCNHCGNDKVPTNVPYIVHESAMARAERTQKRLVWVIVLLIILLVGTNVGWLWYESTMETVEEIVTETYDITQDGAETKNSIINGGDIVNGTEN